MKALLDHIPVHERLVVIEQPAELKISHPNAVRWEAVEEIPGQVAITPSELLAAALRHRPDRIIMGEIRDECGYDLLQAMNTGHGGTLSTIHAKSAWDALNRLSDLALSARPNLNHAFMRSETAEAIDFVLYCERDHTGRRRVRELITVNGYSHADQMLPDRGDLSCFRCLTPAIQLENPTRIRGHFDAPSCCQSGCTAQLVSESASACRLPSCLKTQRSGARGRPLRSLCQHEMSCGLGEHLPAEAAKSDFGPVGVSSASYPVLCSVTLRGLSGALRLGVVFCFGLRRPFGSTVLQKFDARQRAVKLSPRSTPWHLGAGPTRWLCQG